MGGYGSSRWGTHIEKGLVNNCLTIDINYLNRNKLIKPGNSFIVRWKNKNNDVRSSISIMVYDGEIALSYKLKSSAGDSEKIKYKIPLDWTLCNFGGERPWFLCPNIHCWRRCAKLYLSQKYFLCRRCNKLVYGTQRMNLWERLFHKAGKIKSKLDYGEDKPKGMHWKTYYDLIIRKEKAYRDALVSYTRAGLNFMKKVRKNT